MTGTRFDDLFFRAVIATGALTIAFPFTLYRSLTVDFTYIAVFLGGGLTVIVLEVITIAALLLLESKKQDRANVALSEGHRAAHGGEL